MKRNPAILCWLSDLAGGKLGSSLSYEALKIALKEKESDLLNALPVYRSIDFNDETHTVEDSQAKYIDKIYEINQDIFNKTSKILKKNYFPIIISGDHSNAIGTIAALKNHFSQRLGIIWIDAHADLHTPFTTPSGNIHGFPLAACLNIDNKENKINTPQQKTLDYWNLLKNLGDYKPKVYPQDIFFLGLRSYQSEEMNLINQHDIQYLNAEQVRKIGIDKTLSTIWDKIDACEKVFVSFDMDGLDMSLTTGTGTPEENGFYEKEIVAILKNLLGNEKTCAFEISEINPLLDIKNSMAKTIADILIQVEKKLFQ